LVNETTTLVSVNQAGTGTGNGASFSAVISANGRFVAFDSAASNLVSNDSNGAKDVFVRDLVTGITTLVSVNAAGTASGNALSALPGPMMGISADGHRVLFMSAASDLTANDNNGAIDVFVRDLIRQTTTLVSVNAGGTGSGNGRSYYAHLSADGERVCFASEATDLTHLDTSPSASNIYVRDLGDQTTTLVSVNQSGKAAANADSGNPSMSADGQVVVFQSSATDLVPGENGRLQNLFVRILKKHATAAVTENYQGTGTTGGGGGIVSMSRDGGLIAFSDPAQDLVPNDDNKAWDVFVRDVNRRQTILVSQRDPSLAQLLAPSLQPKSVRR
jgi:Tol biopolymer transport system component